MFLLIVGDIMKKKTDSSKIGKKTDEAKKKLVFKVKNIVAHMKLDMDLDLYKLAAMSDDIRYEPEIFPGAKLKLKDPRVSFLIFRNGKINIAGARKEEDLKKGIKKFLEIIGENPDEYDIEGVWG